MNLLVTGGTGFIGSHVSLLLLEQGHNVFIIDSLVNSSENVVNIINELSDKKAHFFKGDLKNKKDINLVFDFAKSEKMPIEAVFHFAGLKSVSNSMIHPFSYWENNVFGTHNLLKMMKKYNCKKIIFSSSATVYGDQYDAPISEEVSPKPINTYGFTKLSVENLLLSIYSNENDDWHITILRYFNPAGNHFSGMIGEDPKGIPTNLFPILCKVAAGKIDKLIVNGNDWNTADGTGVRDYIHVMDIAEGHIKALDHSNKKKKSFLVLNLGTGKGTSVLEFVKTFERVNQIKLPYEIGIKRIGDSAEVYADCDKAKRIIGWKAKRSIDDICKDGWNWQQKRL